MDPSKNGHEPVLRLENLSKSYLEGGKRHTVLRDVTLAFPPSGVVAILGKSGSGKTTLLNLISGIDPADSGSIYLGEQNLTGMSDLERTLLRRTSIGFIFQFFNLIPTLTVWENVTLPLELVQKLDSPGRERAEGLLAAVGLADRKQTYPDRLSGGEQQRVAIARALMNDPAILLADEPTGNLDEETGRAVMTLLENLARQSGRLLILVTHNQEAAAIADAVYVLKEGTLSVENG